PVLAPGLPPLKAFETRPGSARQRRAASGWTASVCSRSGVAGRPRANDRPRAAVPSTIELRCSLFCESSSRLRHHQVLSHCRRGLGFCVSLFAKARVTASPSPLRSRVGFADRLTLGQRLAAISRTESLFCTGGLRLPLRIQLQ